MVATHTLGYPRIGRRRELKAALEAYWRGETDEECLWKTGTELRAAGWREQQKAGLRFITAGDFSFYDQILDHAVLLGGVPERFGFDPRRLTRAEYFMLARGNADQPALEMTKWFDTNYHYLVPELAERTRFDGGPEWYLDEVREALDFGRPVKPALIGPLTFLRLSKAAQPGFDRLRLLDSLADRYSVILGSLKAAGIEWLQIDEPALCLDLEPAWLDAFDRAYTVLAQKSPKLLLTTYFDGVEDHIDRIVRLPVHGIHLDLVRAPSQIGIWREKLRKDWVLSAGAIDGRNIWRAELKQVLGTLLPLHQSLGDRLWIAPSCSLLHVPVSVESERELDGSIRPWLAFADQKLEELRILGVALDEGEAAVRAELSAAAAAQQARRDSPHVADSAVRARVEGLTRRMEDRSSPFQARSRKQRARLDLPPLPTTTIGSFPQTPAVRGTRAAYKRGEISRQRYLEAMRAEIRHAVERQEALGLDVLVHGEAERNDMVEFFGERMQGLCITQEGWVQSYGSRCVKPPILYGDVMRSGPMTVETARYAQSLTRKPMKGMLTGPITMLQWSFVRDDQPRALTALQLALAIREEVRDLEENGIRLIQIDEPALREGLPLKKRDWPRYLDWAVRCFRLASAVAGDETQIHSHMCYADFNDILPAIAAMDADVITIESARSGTRLLDGFGEFRYPNEIGPGVYDIHSARVPSVEEMLERVERACAVIPSDRLWINPDCGLKTRGWPETEQALLNMVQAARRMRIRLMSSRMSSEAARV